jgi:hypothetical protein
LTSAPIHGTDLPLQLTAGHLQHVWPRYFFRFFDAPVTDAAEVDIVFPDLHPSPAMFVERDFDYTLVVEGASDPTAAKVVVKKSKRVLK